MLSKWDSTSVVDLQQQITAVVDPIVARHEHYKTASANMLSSISIYFFNETNKDKILEVTHFIAGNNEQEPVNHQFLQKKFDNLVQFTQTIQECGLGLDLEQGGDFFGFNVSEGLKTETVEFMQAAVHQIVLVPEEKPTYYGGGNLYVLYPNPDSSQEKIGDSNAQYVRSDYRF